MNKDIKIAVIGAGAIGGTTAAFIAKAGYDVELVCKYKEIADKANAGLEIVGIMGNHTVKIKSVEDVEQLSCVKDYIFIATKAYDMPEQCDKALKFAHKDTLFLSMQNGIPIDAMAEVVGEDRTVGCSIGYGATMLEYGKLDVTSDGEYVIGMKNSDKDLSELKEILDAAFKTEITNNIFETLYSKLIVNSCITSLGAISGLYLGEMLKRKPVRDIFLKIMCEAMEVADKMGIKVPPYGGKLDYYGLVKSGFLNRVKAHLVVYIVGLNYKRLKSSSLQSLERGRKTEIDYFNGYIANKAKQYNIEAPINEAITDMIKEIENGDRKIDVSNFTDRRIMAGLK